MLPFDIPGALSELECSVLADTAAQSGARHALEVGHLYGRSTAVLLMALPADCAFVTVDHHRGDQWSGPIDPEAFSNNVAPFVGTRDYTFVNGDMLAPDVMLEVADHGPFDFVFYDADHSERAVANWWACYRMGLSRSCTLVFDDADWEEQGILTTLAVADGFRSVRTRDYWRGQQDKGDPQTYTLEVMRRDA